MSRCVVATRQGVVTLEGEGGRWGKVARGLEAKQATSVIAREGVILAGTTDGVFRSDDGGKTWDEASRGISARHIRWLANHPDVSDLEFAGTEPAGIFVSHDGGDSWRGCTEVAEMRDRHKWSLPYSPEAGCVRGFAFHGDRGYAAVEVGGVLRTDDQGETWQLVEGSDGNPDLEGPPEPLVYPDVHSISVHAWSRDVVVAPTGGGFYRSTDGGKTWSLLYDCYCRAAWMEAKDPQHMILGPADGVDRDGRIEATNDGGITWMPASSGMQVPWRRGMVERFAQIDDDLLAVLSNGELWEASLTALEWRRFEPEIGGVTAAAALEA